MRVAEQRMNGALSQDREGKYWIEKGRRQQARGAERRREAGELEEPPQAETEAAVAQPPAEMEVVENHGDEEPMGSEAETERVDQQTGWQ